MTEIEHSYEFTIKTIGGGEEKIQVNNLSTRTLLRLGIGVNSGSINLGFETFEKLVDESVPKLLDRKGPSAINFESLVDLTMNILKVDAGLDIEELKAKKEKVMEKMKEEAKIEN